MNRKLLLLTFSMMTLNQALGQVDVIKRPTVGRDITRPDGRVLKGQISISGDEVKKGQELTMLKINRALMYFEKNPEIRKNRISEKKFLLIKKILVSGKIEEIQKLDRGTMVKLPHDKEGMTVELLSDLKTLEDFGGSLLDSEDEKNLKSVYAKAWTLLNDKLKEKFLSPEIVKKLTLREVETNLALIYPFFTSVTYFPPKLESPGWTYDCESEIGQEHVSLGDRANRCQTADFHSDSLFTHTDATLFPLKYYHTCIKNQGNRGTCVSFAINGVLESLLMLKEDKSYNLSEQFTYLYGEVYSDHMFRYDYGLNTGGAIQKMNEKDVRFQFEQFWEYNPSRSMDDNRTGNSFLHSCDGYSGEMCTDFAFQSVESITGIWPFQNFNYSVPSTGTSKNVQVIDSSNIFMWWNVEGSLDMAINLTKTQVPLVVSFDVKQNFMDTDESGYVYNVSGSDSVGGHAAIILGFVPNDKLPAGVTRAAEKGFFIVKNSWGTGNGDCGYFYVDYRYLKNNVNGIFTITIN